MCYKHIGVIYLNCTFSITKEGAAHQFPDPAGHVRSGAKSYKVNTSLLNYEGKLVRCWASKLGLVSYHQSSMIKQA